MKKKILIISIILIIIAMIVGNYFYSLKISGKEAELEGGYVQTDEKFSFRLPVADVIRIKRLPGHRNVSEE